MTTVSAQQIVLFPLLSEACLPSYGPAQLTKVHFTSMHREPCSFLQIKHFPKDVDPTNPLMFTVVVEGKEKVISAPEAIRKQLAHYLNSPPKEKNYDCFSFAHEMLDIPYYFSRGIFFDEWEIRDIRTDSQVPVGKALFQWERSLSDASVRHISIYLGDGFFLSKAGEGATPLIVADLSTMKILWGGNTLTVLENYKGKKLSSRQ